MGSEDVQFRNEKQNKKPKTNNQRKPTNPTLLLDLCSVRKRLLAVCHAQCSDTWLALSLEHRGSQGLWGAPTGGCVAQEWVHLEHKQLIPFLCWNHPCLLVLNHKPRIHCRDTTTEPLLPPAALGAFLSGSSDFPKLQIKPRRVTECTEYLLILGHLQTEQSRRLESSFWGISWSFAFFLVSLPILHSLVMDEKDEELTHKAKNLLLM